MNKNSKPQPPKKMAMELLYNELYFAIKDDSRLLEVLVEIRARHYSTHEKYYLMMAAKNDQ